MTQDRIDKIQFKLHKLAKYLKLLNKYKDISQNAYDKDDMLQAAIERRFHLACEVVLDIANMLIAEYRFRSPEDYRDSIVILGEEKVLEEDFAKNFAGIAGFRNILVHHYLEIDNIKVVNHLKNDLDSFDSFAKQITQYLS